MRKILTAAINELVLLSRDRAGLLVLFFMPVVLVVILTLVQQNIMELTGQTSTRMLFLDRDQGPVGAALRERLSATGMTVVPVDRDTVPAMDLEAAVRRGEYQVGVVVLAGASNRMAERAARLVEGETVGEGAPVGVDIQIFFDPGIMAGLRSGIRARLEMAVQVVSVGAAMRRLEEKLTDGARQLGVPEDLLPLPPSGLTGLTGVSLLEVRTGADNGQVVAYNPVQQNVPAWALFGMFFTAVSIAASILRERTSGLGVRLATLPVSPLQLLTGKVLAFLLVCFCQFLLVALVGAFLFQHLGLPAFSIAADPFGVGVIILFSGLAACGFGILLGTACTTYEQASTIGATFVVTSAAIGGVMVPVYAMPGVMRDISIVSPLNWSLNAFHDILIRGEALAAVADDLVRLTLFFVIMLFFSWKLSKIRV